MDLKSLSVQWAPYLLGMAAWMIVTAFLHATIAWLGGPDFATRWPRLTRFFLAARINPIGMLQAVLGSVPPPPKPPFVPSEITPVLPPRVPPLVVLAMALFVLTVLAGACSAAQTQAVVADVTVVDKALQDADKICVDTEVLLGVATPTEVAFACSIDAMAEKALEAEIAIEAAAVAQMVAKSTASPGARAVCRP